MTQTTLLAATLAIGAILILTLTYSGRIETRTRVALVLACIIGWLLVAEGFLTALCGLAENSDSTCDPKHSSWFLAVIPIPFALVVIIDRGQTRAEQVLGWLGMVPLVVVLPILAW